jgi:hypothetical protein
VRTVLASLACALTLTAAALGAQLQVAHVFTLRGYYALDFYPIWQSSDNKPWYVLKQAPWADPLLLKWGYVAVSHDGQRYYCLIQEEPPVGTRLSKRTYICGNPATAEMLYTNNWRPKILTYGSPPPMARGGSP